MVEGEIRAHIYSLLQQQQQQKQKTKQKKEKRRRRRLDYVIGLQDS